MNEQRERTGPTRVLIVDDERLFAELLRVALQGADGIEVADVIYDVATAVRRLPDRQREVVGLRHRSDLSFLEIGELMGCSEDAAKMLYHRALKVLRAELKPDV